MIFGTFLNPKLRWTGKVGFQAPASTRLGAMLRMQDAHHRP
jgi:hypothetical protein